MLDNLFVALVAQKNAHTRIEESKLAIAMLQLFEIELCDILESIMAGLEGNASAFLQAVRIAIARDLRRIAFLFKRVHCITMLKAHPVLFAVAPDHQLQPLAQRVDDRYAYAVQAA